MLFSILSNIFRKRPRILHDTHRYIANNPFNVQPTTIDAPEFADAMKSMSLPLDSPVVLGTSGGVDSMALLRFMNEYMPGKIVSCSIDHGLRPESGLEVEKVRAWCDSLGVKHCSMKLDLSLVRSSNLQTVARQRRFDALKEICKQHNTNYLFMAHHLDDQLETFLFRLMRGSGIDGLACMRPVSRMPDLVVIRPLLSFRKDRLILTCKKRFNQDWLEDPSNHKLSYERNRIRFALDPNANNATAMTKVDLYHLYALFSQHAEDNIVEVEHILKTHVAQDVDGYKVYLYSSASSSNTFIEACWFVRIVRRLCQTLSDRIYPPSAVAVHDYYHHLKRFLESRQTSGNCDIFPAKTIGGCLLSYKLRENALYIRKQPVS